MKNINNLIAAGFLAATLCATSVQAAAPAGTLLFKTGKVSVQRDQATLNAVRGMAVHTDDVIITQSGSLAHLRMNDGALISLKPNTEFQIEQFQLRRALEPVAVTREEAPQRAIFALFKGGMRVISGLIGGREKSEFQVKTLVATIGIRGTTFDVACPESCAQGVYAGTSDGAIVVRNQVAELILEDNEFALVKSLTSAPQRLTTPPAALRDVFEVARTEDDDDENVRSDGDDDRAGADEDYSEPPVNPSDDSRNGREDSLIVETERPLQGTVRDIAFGTAPLLDANEGSSQVLSQRTEDVSVDQAGNLLAFTAAVPVQGGDNQISLQPARLSIINASAENLDTGYDASTGVRWGRWGGGNANARLDDGNRVIDLSQASLHWIMDAARDGAPELPVSGQREFALFGNTDPTDQNGNRGVLGSAQLSADFSNQTVSSSLSLFIANETWTASGNGQLNADGIAHHFSGDYGSVSIDAAGAGSGRFSGFITDQAEGAGLHYLLDGGGRQINGTASFRSEQ